MFLNNPTNVSLSWGHLKHLHSGFFGHPWRETVHPPNLSVENDQALSVKFILPPPPPCFLCNYMVAPAAVLGSHVLWICWFGFMLFVVKKFKTFLCLRWSVQSIFPPPVSSRVCVLRCESDFYFLFSELCFPLSLSPCHRQYFIFTTCN